MAPYKSIFWGGDEPFLIFFNYGYLYVGGPHLSMKKVFKVIYKKVQF